MRCTIHYHDVEQPGGERDGSEWFALRKGIPTASRADMILTPKTMKPSASQKKLIALLIGERYSLVPPERIESYTNSAMRHGQNTESEARRYFSMQTGLEAYNGGFCLSDDGNAGCSPDGIIGLSPQSPGLGSSFQATCEEVLELKCPSHAVHAEYVIDSELPDDYRCQVHHHLIVTGAKACWFLSYHLGLPPLLLKVVPDDFTDKLRAALDAFHLKFQEALSKFAHDPAEVF